MVRRESCRLKAWITDFCANIVQSQMTQTLRWLQPLPDAFSCIWLMNRHMPTFISLADRYDSGTALSRLRSTAKCGLALTRMARCRISCDILRHHAPDETGQLPGDCCFGNIGFLSFAKYKFIVSSPEPFIRTVSIGNDRRGISRLPLLKCF